MEQSYEASEYGVFSTQQHRAAFAQPMNNRPQRAEANSSIVPQGPFEACYECLKRRIRYNQERPTCTICHRVDIESPSDTTQERLPREHGKVRTVEQVNNSTGQHALLTANVPQDRYWSVIPATVATNREDAIMNSFWNNFTVIAPECGSCGILGIARERYTAWPPESAAALATRTVASELFNTWRGTPLTEAITHSIQGRALSAVKIALTKDTTALQDDTLLAVLLLHFHANLFNYKSLTKGSSNHQEGAHALVSFRGQQNFESRRSQHLLRAVRSYLISSAIRAGELLKLDTTIWNSRMETHRSKSGELDLLGLEIVELKADYAKTHKPETGPQAIEIPSHTRTASALLTRAVTVDHHLRTWETSLPLEWRAAAVMTPPLVISPANNTAQSPSQWTGNPDVYFSVEAADTINRYRVYRLICLQIILSCHLTEKCGAAWNNHGYQQHSRGATPNEFEVVSYQIQKMVDQICNSVAFHLGDQQEAQNPFALSESISSRPPTSHVVDDIPRIPISSGSWYILGPLSFLVKTFSPRSSEITQLPPLRQGQLEWIEARLFRIMQMHGVVGNLETLDEDHMRRLRGSLQYTSGV